MALHRRKAAAAKKEARASLHCPALTGRFLEKGDPENYFKNASCVERIADDLIQVH